MLWLILSQLLVLTTEAFLPVSTTVFRATAGCRVELTPAVVVFPFAFAPSHASDLDYVSSSLLVASDGGGIDSWRQYVAAVVIALVLIDILLGSPVANSLLDKARPRSEDDDDINNRFEEGEARNRRGLGPLSLFRPPPPPSPSALSSSSSKPRMDVDAFAKNALDRAEGVTQLREYLDAQKTDWDRMEDLKRKMDQQMAELDEKNREKQ